jgi:DNA mismatch repair protein MutS
MQQYHRMKAEHPDALLFFRMGDFYELFEADAERAAPLLDLVLTSRERDSPSPVPMCGVPFHALEGYVRRCLAAGLSVAIAEQTEDPKSAKGLVRREITEVVTPGLVANADRLEGAAANYLAAVLSDGGRFGLAYLDLSTGEFAASETERRELFLAELDRVAPRELLARDAEKDLPTQAPIRRVRDADFDPRAVAERAGLLPHGLAADERGPDARAAAALVAAVAELQPGALAQLGALRRYRASEHLQIDRSTRRHLELFQNLRDGSSSGTLFETVDRTRTRSGWASRCSPRKRSRAATSGSAPGSSPTAGARPCARRCAAWVTSTAPRRGRSCPLAGRASSRRCAPRSPAWRGSPR